MIRLALGIEYCGRNFNGWQAQDHGRTVQQNLEKALSLVANEPIRVQCAGRTDTGVHAIQQVVHMDTDVQREMHSWLLGGNINLPHDVSICWVKPVADNFHARFSAISRSYRYLIFNRRGRASILHSKVTCEGRPLNEKAMIEAAEYLIGEHDFTSYRAVACQAKNPVRFIHQLRLFRRGDYIVIDVHANAFLQHMVRNIVGVLMEIGLDRRPIVWAEEVLNARDRTLGGMTAVADGLYLVDVEYPPAFSIPKVDASQWPLCL